MVTPMSISPTLLQAVKDRLEYFHDIPLAYGRHYERDLEIRARGLIEMIETIREQEAVAKAGETL
jgi:hypothetical protein